MKKSLILALVAVFAACTARAINVTTDMAMTAANAWVARNAAFGVGGSAQSVITVCDTNAAQTVLWHQVSMAGGGCLIVAPVTEIEPVVAALEDDPGEIPAAHPLRAMLTADMRSRLRFLKLYVEDASLSGGGMALQSATPATEDENAAIVREEWKSQQKSKWRKLGVSSGGFQLMEAESVGVPDPIDVEIRVVDGFEKGGYLTHWSQSNAGGGHCFNYHTPNHAVCGCVATACSAVLQFFKAASGPEEGTSNTCTYNGTSGKYTTIGGEYNWASLPSNWGGEESASSSLSDEQRELLGRVAYDAGVCLGMMWTDGESGAFTRDIASVLRDNFGFQHAALVDKPKLEQYHKLIYMQCWAGAPVVMGIKGHAVVACGYGKDAEGVPRARVFMGWGGSGDAWYALPKIDTQSVMGGSTYLSEEINCVITMIGYQDDKVVPVCGQIIPSLNATVECGGESANANDKGYFGLRISAATPAGEVVPVSVAAGTAEKSASVVLGTAASTSDKKYAFNAAALCSWIPDDIVITLLKSETATTFAEAKEKALATIGTENPKAILAFSGTWGTNFTVSCELATAAAWDYLYSIDYDNIDDFTNKYVVLCTPYSLSGTSASDGNPSFAVFDPRAITTAPDKLWSFYNGRYSYWTIGSAICTNDAELASSAVTNTVVGGALVTYVTGEDITNAFISVMELGRTNFLTGVSGITLNVEGIGEVQGAVEPNYGFYENTYSNGETIVATASEFVTNSAQNIEFRCAGWLLSSTNSDEVVTNDASAATTAEFAPVPNGAYTLTWLWETNAMKITVEVDSEKAGTVSPGTGWFPYGEPVVFTAVGTTNEWGKAYPLISWQQGDPKYPNDNDNYAELGNMLVFDAKRPVTIRAAFGRSTTSAQQMPTFNLKVVNYGTDDEGVPETLLYAYEPPSYEFINGGELPYDTEKELVREPLSVQLSTNAFEDAEGAVQTCRGWMLSNEEGVLDFVWFEDDNLVGNADDHPETLARYKSGLVPLSVVGFKPSDYSITNGASVTLTWLWEIPTTDDVTNVFDIVWNDGLDNLSVGYKTNLISEVALGSKGWTLDDLTVNAPTGWVATVALEDGNVVATLARDDAALAAAMESCELIVTNAANGTLAVEATITNGLRGFRYVLYGSDELDGTWEPVANGTYESGTPAAQAQGTAENPVDKVELSITVTPGDSAAGPKRFYKVVSGATSEPLDE